MGATTENVPMTKVIALDVLLRAKIGKVHILLNIFVRLRMEVVVIMRNAIGASV